MAEPRILPSADLDDGVNIGDGSSIWHLAQVRGGAEIGENVVVGRGAYIGTGVEMGDNCSAARSRTRRSSTSRPCWATASSSAPPSC